ncbi:18328_t:CDS:1, partial [Dentiscutata erythropus]
QEGRKDKLEKDISELSQQVQSMSINYARLTALLTTQVESSTSRPRATNRTNNTVTCFKCGEKGHYARDCLSEKEPQVQKSTQPTRITNRETEAHYSGVNDGYSYEREMYTIDNRYQPYDKENREQFQPNSESQWEGRLRNKTT